MTLRVAVDFGTSSTCVVASVNGRDPQVVVVDGQPLMSSAVYAAPDGTLFVGQEAERQAAVDPSRYEPNPKRRVDEGELLLGDTVLRVLDVVHAVLRRAITEARRVGGGAEVDLLVLTHPADWGAIRTRLLRQAAGQLAHDVTLVSEPVAAAVFHAATFAPSEVNQERTVEFSGHPGDTLAVLDLGGGTVDVSVVRRGSGTEPAQRRAGFHVLATRGDPSFGGADIDQALLEYVGSLVSAVDPPAWRQLVEGRDLADRRRRRVLRQDVRGAKETLSRHAYTDVPMPAPFADAHVTREDLERLVAAPLGRAVELTSAAIDEAQLRPKQLTAIFLVGGSSRIPMVSRLIHERTQLVPTTLDQPETVVARGALRVTPLDPDRAARAPGTQGGRAGMATPLGAQRTKVVRPSDVPRARQTPSTPPPGVPPTSAPGSGYPPRGGYPRVPGAQAQSQAQPHAQPHGAPARTEAGPARRGRGGKLALLIGSAVFVAAAVVTGLVLWDGGEQEQHGRTFAQYDYRFDAPQDWAQSGDNVAKRQVVVKPGEATGPRDDDLVVVQEFVLPYDTVAQRQRFVGELRGQVQGAGRQFSDFNADARFAGKDVIQYREHKPAATADWYVVTHGTTQVSIGCQYATPAQERVRAACEQVVSTLQITN